jgi:hypothetical protein
MPITDRWDHLTPSEWEEFALEWLEELRDDDRGKDSRVGQAVVGMNFTARPEQQWTFILAAVAHAGDEELGHIAAGPIEHLLGWHGELFIEAVERQAALDPTLARMMTKAWRYRMTDEVCSRVQAIQRAARSALGLPPDDEHVDTER